MGEAKRRARLIAGDAPEVRDILTVGRPIHCDIIGAGLVPLLVATNPAIFTGRDPAQRSFRLAFLQWDLIKRGEMAVWPCVLCDREYTGFADLSCFVIMDRIIGRANDQPALVAMICRTCDSVSTDETRRRVQEMFGLLPMQEGHA